MASWLYGRILIISANIADNTDSANEADDVDGGVGKESKWFSQERKEVVALPYGLRPWKNFDGNTENIFAAVTYRGEVKRWLFYSRPYFLWSLWENKSAEQLIFILHSTCIPCQCCLQVDQETDFQRPDNNQGLELRT